MTSYQFNFDAAIGAIPQLLAGLLVTIELSALVMALSLPLALMVALGRLTRFRLARAVTYGYTELFRTTPLLVQISWIYYVLPIALNLHPSAFVSAVIALTLNLVAYLAEAFRGSIQSIDPGQREAGLATGMSEAAVLRRIVLPQAALRAVPLVASNWIGLFKNTSLVAIIGVHEMLFVAQDVAQSTYRPMEILTVAALIYFAVTFPQSLVVNRLFERFRVIE
ncbi:MAG: amino acid ABC transporter permease [Candidatus Dormibacter sp.]